MPKKLKPSEYVGLRKRCMELLEEGHKPIRISEMLGRSPSWVHGTLKRYTLGGESGLEARKPPGAKSKISELDVKALITQLEKGAVAHGFAGEIWTRKRVGVIIEKMFGQQYDPSQIGRILKKAGWTLQKPQVKARQQNPEAVAKWRQEGLVAIKKKPNPKIE
ncbi:MAG: winged helix-turn-helix domain-containing protein [Saprospiraceae bacterium]